MTMPATRRPARAISAKAMEALGEDELSALNDVKKEFCLMARSFALDARRSLQKILKAFKKYDRSGDGKISTDELQPMMTELFGWDGESEARRQKKVLAMRKFIEKNDLDKDGAIDFIEFVGLLLLLDDKSWETELRDRFSALDMDRDGCISYAELLNSLSPQVGREAARAYLAEFDKDGDGKISFQEFVMRVLEVGLVMPEGGKQDDDPLLKYREVFSSYSDGNSYISIKEMGSLARYLKLNPTDAQLRKLRKEYDVDGDGTINFREFVILMLELESLRGSDDPEFQTLWNALMVFDKDKNGYIDGMELISVLQEVVEGGQPLTTEEVRKLIRAVDRNGDGKISCRELAYFLLGGLEANKSPVEMAVGNSAAEKAFPVRVSGPSKKSLMHD